MKKILFFVLLLFGVFGDGKVFFSRAQGLEEVLRGSLPQISSPIAQQWGIKKLSPGHRVMVGNSFYGPCRVFIYGKEYLASPGELLWDVKYNIPKYSISIPVAALCYWDEKLSQFAGWATRVLWLHGGWEPQTISWMISYKDIVQDHFSHPQEEQRTKTTLQLRMKKISFPRPYWENDFGIQILNASTFEIAAHINEIDMGDIKPQSVGFFRLAAKGVPIGWGIQVFITISTPQGVEQFLERVSWTGSFYVRQIVFDGQKIYPAY